MKTYIQYGSSIKSKDIMEAISLSKGVGPICGFGSVQADVFAGNNPTMVTLKQGPFETSSKAIQGTIKDMAKYHNITIFNTNYNPTSLIENSLTQQPVKFGCITRDGYEYASTKDDIQVPIVNSARGNFNEILVFAYHDYINVGIENPVYFKAYWNRGDTSFYNFYKNAYEDKELSNFKGYEPNYTYEDLVTKAKVSLGDSTTDDGGTLIGIYGVNPYDPTDYFSIVPYNGNVLPMGFDKSVVDYFDAYIKLIKQFLGEYPSSIRTIKEYIDRVTANTKADEEQPGTVPIGGIILWSKPNIPDGYVICDGSNGTPDLRGKFVYGSGATDSNGNPLPLGSTGGSKTAKLTLNNLPAHSHGIPRRKWKAGDNANNRDMVESAGTDFTVRTQETGKTDPDPISIVPPYMVLYYIMRIR